MAESEQVEDRKRSPLYPSIELGEAVARAADLYHNDKGAAGTLDVLAHHWETTVKSSSFLQAVASLKRYGLLLELEGKPRRLKLTKDALDILMLPDGDPRRTAAIKRAALTPKPFADLWEEFGPDLPSDQNLQHHLVTTRDFLPVAAADLIKQYKKTIAFAGLGKDDKLPNGDSGEAQGTPKQQVPAPTTGNDWADAFARMFPQRRPANLSPADKRQQMDVAVKQDVFNLDEGQVVLQWPTRLSPDSFEDLKDWLELQLRKIGRAVVRPEQPKGADDPQGE